MQDSVKKVFKLSNFVYDLECSLKDNLEDHQINLILREENTPLEIHSFNGDLTKLLDQDPNWKFFKSTKYAYEKLISKQIKEDKVKLVKTNDNLSLEFDFCFMDDELKLCIKFTKQDLLKSYEKDSPGENNTQLYNLVKQLKSKIDLLEKRIPKVQELVVQFPSEFLSIGSFQNFKRSFELNVINSSNVEFELNWMCYRENGGYSRCNGRIE